MSSPNAVAPVSRLELAPFTGLRYAVDADRLGRLLSPPYDVIDDQLRSALLAGDPDNVVSVILPRTEDGDDPYAAARRRLDAWVADGVLVPDAAAALYVYEMRTADGGVTRGLLGAVALADPADGVILPHENVMAGPVADRLALMEATDADLEPIYLVYDGGGPASEVVAAAGAGEPVARAVTPDGTVHRIWPLREPDVLRAVAADLADRKALIADGHHRYATYRERQARRRASSGAGPWDRGLALLVDSTTYGPQVHPIHRVLTGLRYDRALEALQQQAAVRELPLPQALAELAAARSFAAVLVDGSGPAGANRAALVADLDPELVRAARQGAPGEPTALWDLDVTLVHRVLVATVWSLPDDVEAVGFAHSVDEAIAAASTSGGSALLLRATLVGDVARVAAAGARMPRKSTLFTPKPASGLVMRRFLDQT